MFYCGNRFCLTTDWIHLLRYPVSVTYKMNSTSKVSGSYSSGPEKTWDRKMLRSTRKSLSQFLGGKKLWWVGYATALRTKVWEVKPESCVFSELCLVCSRRSIIAVGFFVPGNTKVLLRIFEKCFQKKYGLKYFYWYHRHRNGIELPTNRCRWEFAWSPGWFAKSSAKSSQKPKFYFRLVKYAIYLIIFRSSFPSQVESQLARC